MGAALKLKSNFMQAIISAYSKFGFNHLFQPGKLHASNKLAR
jgi:hypothetical protein